MNTIQKISEKYFFYHPSDGRVLEETLLGGKLAGKSKIIEGYESALAHRFEVENAIAVSSGSAALHTALYALGIDADAEVIVAASATIPTVLPILTLKGKLVFVDVVSNSFEMDVNDVERKISTKTKAVIVVPNWGYPQDYTRLIDLLRVKKIPLIEDAAQAHFSKIGHKYVGTFGDIGCFSTHDKKILSTGEGGFVLTNNTSFAEKMRSFVQLGGMNGVNYGVNYKLSGMQAALGKNRLKHIDEALNLRKKNAQIILEGIKASPLKEISYPRNGVPNYYSLVLNNTDHSVKGRKFASWLIEQGVPSDFEKYNIKPLYEYPLFYSPEIKCPNVENLLKSSSTIPVHPNVSSEQLDYIVDTINRYWR